MKRFNVFVLASCLATLPMNASAEDISSVPLLDFEAGVRNLGMGATGAASTSETASSYYNPASLSWADGITATYESQPWDILNLELAVTETRVTFGRGKPAGTWRLGAELGYRRLHWEYDDFLFPGTYERVELTDEYYSGALALGFHHPNISVSTGVSAKHATIASEETDDYSVSTMSAGLIVAFPLLVDGSRMQPRIGASIDNLDDGIEIDETTYGVENVRRIGAGFDFATPERPWAGRNVSAAAASMEADYTSPGTDDWRWAVGWEASIFDVVFARAGFQWGKDDVFTERDLGLGLGWEFGRWIARADYAHRTPNNDLDIDFSRDCYGITLGARL